MSISVIITTFNGEHYLKDQLNSVINQSIKPDEIIIADDCSTDDTLNIIKSVQQISSLAIKYYVNKTNLGYVKNYSNAILRANGDYIFLCDQDDVWEKNKIEITIEMMKKYNAEIACTGFKLIDKNGKKISFVEEYNSNPLYGYENWSYQIRKISFFRLIWGNFSPGCTYCLKREIIQIYNKIRNFDISHDYQLLLIGANRKAAIYIDYPLISYRIHDNNTIGVKKNVSVKNHNFFPKLVIFLHQLTKLNKIQNLIFIDFILFLRLPKLRKIVIEKLNLRNSVRF